MNVKYLGTDFFASTGHAPRDLLTNVAVDPLILCGFYHSVIVGKASFLKTSALDNVFSEYHNFG